MMIKRKKSPGSYLSCLLLAMSLIHIVHAAPEIYKDPKASIETRVDDLLNRLTLEEKIRLLHGNVTTTRDGRFLAAGVPRLRIKQLSMLDGRQGVRTFDDTLTTALPCTLSLSCTWNKEAAYTFGKVLADEILALDRHIMLAPMINLVRTPLGGRNFENLGEDPLLAGHMAAAYIKGIQDQKVAACACLIVANDYEFKRHVTSSNMDDRTLREAHLLPYEIAFTLGNVWSMMPANSLFNGIHCAHNKHLLQDVMKDDIGFDGVMLTDWRAAYDPVEAALGGTDMTMGFCAYVFGDGKLLQAVKNHQVPLELINDKACRVIRLYIRTGLLDPTSRPKGELETPKHRALARQLASEGMVLLKNQGSLLPLDPSQLKTLLITGPGANSVVKGAGSGDVNSRLSITPLEGLQEALGENVNLIHTPYTKTPDGLLKDAKTADAVIYFATSGKYREGAVLETMILPDHQDQQIKELASINKNLIVVLMSGSGVSVEAWIDEVPAVLGAWFAGQATGQAIADILTGKVNPSGKLSFTMAKSINDYPIHALGQWPAQKVANELPSVLSIDPKVRKASHSLSGSYPEGVYVGHRWFDEKQITPRFAFGFGLSYTRFTLSDLSIENLNGIIHINCKVTNTGDRDGSEVVQVYIAPPVSKVPRPLRELKAFEKVALKKGESKTVHLEVPESTLGYYDITTKQWLAEAGDYGIHVGNSSRNIQLQQNCPIEKTKAFKKYGNSAKN